MCVCVLCLIIAIVNLIHCTKPGQVAESAAPVLAEETAKIYSVPDKKDCEDRFFAVMNWRRMRQ